MDMEEQKNKEKYDHKDMTEIRQFNYDYKFLETLPSQIKKRQ